MSGFRCSSHHYSIKREKAEAEAITSADVRVYARAIGYEIRRRHEARLTSC